MIINNLKRRCFTKYQPVKRNNTVFRKVNNCLFPLVTPVLLSIPPGSWSSLGLFTLRSHLNATCHRFPAKNNTREKRKSKCTTQHNAFEEGRATDGRSSRNWIEKEEWVQIEIGRKEAEFGGNRSHWCLRNIGNIPSCYNINPRYLLPYLGFYWYTLSITYQALIWKMYDLSLD